MAVPCSIRFWIPCWIRRAYVLETQDEGTLRIGDKARLGPGTFVRAAMELLHIVHCRSVGVCAADSPSRSIFPMANSTRNGDRSGTDLPGSSGTPYVGSGFGDSSFAYSSFDRS